MNVFLCSPHVQLVSVEESRRCSCAGNNASFMRVLGAGAGAGAGAGLGWAGPEDPVSPGEETRSGSLSPPLPSHLRSVLED